MLADKSVRDLLAAFSSSDPTPGGGSASALTSATGASLLMMVAGLQKTRTQSDDDRAALGAAAAALDGIRRRLTDAIDADTAAYDAVVGAYKLPKATPDEQAARSAAIQRALQAATDVLRPSCFTTTASAGTSRSASAARFTMTACSCSSVFSPRFCAAYWVASLNL